MSEQQQLQQPQRTEKVVERADAEIVRLRERVKELEREKLRSAGPTNTAVTVGTGLMLELRMVDWDGEVAPLCNLASDGASDRWAEAGVKAVEQADAEIDRLRAEREQLLTALHDAIARPMGVVPASGTDYYDPTRYPSTATMDAQRRAEADATVRLRAERDRLAEAAKRYINTNPLDDENEPAAYGALVEALAAMEMAYGGVTLPKIEREATDGE